MRSYSQSPIIGLTVLFLFCRAAGAAAPSIPLLVGFPVLPGADQADDWVDIAWLEPIPIVDELSPRRVPRPLDQSWLKKRKKVDAVLPDPHNGHELIERVLAPDTHEIGAASPANSNPGSRPAGRLLLVSKSPRFAG